LEQYTNITRSQAFSVHTINESILNEAYSDVVILDELFDTLGPAILSGKSMIFYGSPGTGKTYIAQRIARVFSDSILIPHAILVAGKIVQIFDPVFHKEITVVEDTLNLMLTNKEDPRFARCKRPSIVTGGELTMDMLEVEHDPTTNTYHAPTHIKANNGVFIVDDLGRQRVKPKELLNRWIIPLQERRDFMTVGSGSRFEVPMDMIIAFSTNLDPKELADEAFLRRLGYKIKFSPFPPHEYIKLWKQTCESYNTQFDEEIVNYLIDELYTKDDVPLIPCHPKELISLVNDQCRYKGSELNISKENLARAWKSFFVSSN
jgi:predicted ATPase with chaperone activity